MSLRTSHSASRVCCTPGWRSAAAPSGRSRPFSWVLRSRLQPRCAASTKSDGASSARAAPAALHRASLPLGTEVRLKLWGLLELAENAQIALANRLGRAHAPPVGLLRDKTAVITGGGSGVGLATSEALLRCGCSVVLAVRAGDLGADAATRLAAAAAAGGASLEEERLDLASLASCRAFVARWRASRRRLHLLIGNAGIMCPPSYAQTDDGFELQWQTNYLGHFYLANTLVAHTQRQRQLAANSGGNDTGGAATAHAPLRVVLLTSMAHAGADLSNLADVPYCRNGWHPFRAYANSKLAALLCAQHLDRLLAHMAGGGTATAAGERNAAVAVHPGLVNTDLARGYFKREQPAAVRALSDPFIDRWFAPYALRSPAAAAATVLYAATAPAAEVGGRYIAGVARAGWPLPPACDDAALAEALWQQSAHLAGLPPDCMLS